MATEPVADQIRLQLLIAQRLEVLHGRRTPVRRVAPGPTQGVTRLQWGDGTVLLTHAAQPGLMGRVWAAIYRAQPVTIDSWVCEPEVVSVRLRMPGRRARFIDVVVLGLDQPD